MNKKVLVLAAASMLMLMAGVVTAQEKEAAVEAALKPANKAFNVYADRQSSDNHYIPSGFMGDYGDIKLNDQSADNPHTGSTCIQFVYSAKKSQGQGWAGVYWQNPANNWGSKKAVLT